MSVWALTLRDASFRGVPFKVAAADDEFGRRQVVHEYPSRDEPATEDLGRKADRYEFDAYIVGDDFPSRRDRLVAAIRDDGEPGILVHPRYGVRMVVPLSVRVRHEAGVGRMVRLSLSFVEAGRNATPAGLIDRAAVAIQQAADAVAAVQSRFAAVWNLEGAPQYVIAAAESLVANSSQFLVSVAGPFLPGGAALQLRSLALDTVALARSPVDLWEAVRATGLMFGDAENVPLPAEIMRQYSTLRRYGTNTGGAAVDADEVPLTPPVDETTPGGELQADLQDAFVLAVRTSALADAAAAAVRATYGWYEQAESLRALMVADCDALGELSDDPDVFRELSALRVALFDSVPDPDADLPRLTSTTLAQSEPGVVTAWRLYGDATRAAEIADRNRVPNPMIMPGGVSLSVLTR